MYIPKIFSFLCIIFTFQNCASFDKRIVPEYNFNFEKIKQIEGIYILEENKQFLNTCKQSPDETILGLIVAEALFIQPDLKIEDIILLNIDIINDKYIKFSINGENDRILNESIYSFKVKKDGFIHLKKKMKINGVPYIFGSFVIIKTKINQDKNRNLVIHSSYYNSGAILGIAFIYRSKERASIKLRRLK